MGTIPGPFSPRLGAVWAVSLGSGRFWAPIAPARRLPNPAHLMANRGAFPIAGRTAGRFKASGAARPLTKPSRII
jgi:hypothetical protein